MKRPKIRPLTFTELEARVKTLQSADRSGDTHQAKANALLHQQFSNALNQRKIDHGRRLAAAMKSVGLGLK